MRETKEKRKPTHVAETSRHPAPVLAPQKVTPELDLPRALGNQAYGQFLQAKQRGGGNTPSMTKADRDGVVQRQPQEPIKEEEELQMKTNPAVLQRQMEEEEDLQMKADPAQRMEEDEEEPLQGKFTVGETPVQLQGDGGEAANRTSMPRPLKEGLEALSGIDLSGVRVHRNSSKPSKINALAFAQGQDIHVGPGQEKHLPHEGWHVVQQMQGRVNPTVRANGVSINDDKRMEREADVMGTRALGMKQGESDVSGPSHAGRTPDALHTIGIVQRFAFINQNQVDHTERGLTARMQGMVADNLIRDYTSKPEFEQHAAKQTDYLGNLAAGTAEPETWMRFSPTGMNILGESHIKVPLADVTTAVETTNFIRERFTPETLQPGSKLKSAYERENQAEFQKMGIAQEPDKRKFGGEPLMPKLGFGMTLAARVFKGNIPITAVQSPTYTGKPVQRYLKIAWAHSADVKVDVDAKRAANTPVPVPAKLSKLADEHTRLHPTLNAFITALPVDGFLGDELGQPQNAGLFTPLAEFADAFTDAMVELAASEASSRLTPAERARLSSASSTSDADKETLFRNWRNFVMEDLVKDAARRGVRYAGMGRRHLEFLQNAGTLPPNGHAFDMITTDLNRFVAETNRLKQNANPVGSRIPLRGRPVTFLVQRHRILGTKISGLAAGPVKTGFEGEKQAVETEILSRNAKIMVKVNSTEDWLGTDEVYVLASSTAGSFQTIPIDLNDGESHAFSIPLAQMWSPPSLGAQIEIKVYDEDVGSFLDRDDLIVWMRWPMPFADFRNKRSFDEADYDVTARF